ncbi:M3 family metallopeptidase [Actomonas aquatica]|uniref:M3 family metallopeptidase n=1 Tax=Actomonas aquatica TaxID=2866162 RepID=A0ABZ1C601_9BACT|nr:M3 family metallopeptidase [Opitutus sp. WL0086]WRQ87070.1 M3 family metallopeptidase [Opitutus sp. WL0086]
MLLNHSLCRRLRGAFIMLTFAAGSLPNFAAETDVSSNPLLQDSPLPFGYPQFDLIKPEHFEPAFEVAMQAQRDEIAAIATNPEPATFENTIVALETAGRLLGRIDRIFSNLNGTITNEVFAAVDAKVAPLEAALYDELYLNADLFARVAAIHDQLDDLDLDPESRRLTEQTYTRFVRAGAKLDAAAKVRMSEINAELATLRTQFRQNVLAEVNASALLVDTAAELDGLSASAIATAAQAATDAGHEGKYLIALQNTSGQPALSALTNRDVRARLHAASLARGTRGNAYDNRLLAARTAKLRAERAQLLGYETYAAYALDERTAKTVDAVNGMLGRLAPAAAANVQKEIAALQEAIAADGQDFTLAAHDWDYYAAKVRSARFNYDESELRPYLELNRVVTDGVFYAANQLYGLTFKERPDLPVYHPDVRVWEVFDADGSTLAYFIGDFYARPSKRGGAWMNSYMVQSNLLGEHPVIGNHLNVEKPAAGEPTLLTWGQTNTLFHEFGHALHGMFSDVTYPSHAGTSVPRDFVEFPSQVNEMWRDWPSILEHYAVHYETGEPIPADLLAKIKAAAKFNQGFGTAEYLAASMLDQAWHQLTPEQVPTTAEAVLAFEADALEMAGLNIAAVPPRYRTTYFSHVFAGGYSAGYYSYIWSEVLDADSVEWFKQNGGLTRTNGDHFRDTLLSRGESKDPMELFSDFAGHEPRVEPLLERRGLTSTDSSDE